MALRLDSEESPPPPPPEVYPSNLSAIDEFISLGVLLVNGLTLEEAYSLIDDATCFRSPKTGIHVIVDTTELVESLCSHGLSGDKIKLLPYDADVYGNPILHAGSSTMDSSTTAIPSELESCISRRFSLPAYEDVLPRSHSSLSQDGFWDNLGFQSSIYEDVLPRSHSSLSQDGFWDNLGFQSSIYAASHRIWLQALGNSTASPTPSGGRSTCLQNVSSEATRWTSMKLTGGCSCQYRPHTSIFHHCRAFHNGSTAGEVLITRDLSTRHVFSVGDLVDLPLGGRNREFYGIRRSSYSLGRERELPPLSASQPFYGDPVADGISTPGWILHGGSLPLYHRNGSPTGSTIRHFSIPNLQSMIRNIQSLFPNLRQPPGGSTSLVGYPTDGLTGGRNRYSEGPRFRGSSSRHFTAPDTALQFSHVGLIHYLAGISESLRSLQDAIADPNKLISIFRAYEDFMSGKKIPEQAIVSAVGLAGLYFMPQNGNLHGPAFYCLISFLITAFTTSFAGNQVQDRHPTVAKVLAKVATLCLVVVFFTVVGSLINNLFMWCFIAICAAICLGSFLVGHLK